MSDHVDILDQPESLRRPLMESAVLHGGVLLLILAGSWAGSGRRETWGEPNSLGGGAVGINVRLSLKLRSFKNLPL